MRRSLIVMIALLLFVGATMLTGCGGSGSSPVAQLTRDAGGASPNGVRNGLTGACEILEANPGGDNNLNPNCVVAEPKCIDPYGNPVPCLAKVAFPAASDTGLENGLSVACENPEVAAHNPNCVVQASAACIDPYGNPVPCE